MKLFGFNLFQRKQRTTEKQLAPVDSRSGWWGLIRESFAGAWQQNVEVRLDLVPSYSAVFACITLIAGDVGKLSIQLLRENEDSVWTKLSNSPFLPVLIKPNHYQNRLQFIQQWIMSKLLHGNAYVLKERDARGIVNAMYVLDPNRVTVLVSPDGGVYYQLQRDDLAGVNDEMLAIPAKEIIHDTMVPIFHPLVGVSPIYASGLAATQGLRIQNNSAKFFANNLQPGGMLLAPDKVSDETAARLKAHWEQNYSGANVGRVAVLGDGMKYEPMSMTAEDSQLIEQLKWSAETVCSCFHVPPYMVGIGPLPSYNNVEALNQQYYSQCIQTLLEAAELSLDHGLELPRGYKTHFDIEGLLKMDTASRFKTISEAIGGGWMAPNEGRLREGLKPVEGGESPYLQQQNYSLAALAKRDALGIPSSPAPSAPAPAADKDDGEDAEDVERIADAFLRKELADAQYT